MELAKQVSLLQKKLQGTEEKLEKLKKDLLSEKAGEFFFLWKKSFWASVGFFSLGRFEGSCCEASVKQGKGSGAATVLLWLGVYGQNPS